MSFNKVILQAVIVFFAFVSISASESTVLAQLPKSDVVLVMPFENLSTDHQEYNWVGESFADQLSDLLSIVPDLVVLSTDERQLAYERIRLPLVNIPTRATAIKVAQSARASMIVIGTFTVTPAEGDSLASVQGYARIIRVTEGMWVGDPTFDGNWLARPFFFGGAVTTLQKMQGQLAFHILYERDKALPFRQNEFIDRSTRVPQKAFEALLKGIQTTDRKTREIFLKNALKLYSDENSGQTYPQAAFELGQLYLQQQDWKNAAEYFSRVPKYRENEFKTAENPGRVLKRKETYYPEAAFYSGLAYWKLNDLTRSLEILVPLATDLPLTGIYNNAGAVSAQAARGEKKPEDRNSLLAQAVNLLSRAAASSPDDPTVLFNYGYALFLQNKYKESAEQLREVIKEDQRDGYSYFLLAKALEKMGSEEAATAADDQARRFLSSYAKLQVEWQKSESAVEIPVRLRQSFNRNDYFHELHASAIGPRDDTSNGASQSIAKAKELYQAGQDDEALVELRKVLTIDPMSGEAYLLIGRINQRRGDQEPAISALKTAIAWDPKLIDAHVLLGRIFLERGDRAQAMAYARSAIQINPNNQEAIALQRAIQTAK